MNIKVFVSLFHPFQGGLETHVLEVYKGLSLSGYDVQIYTSNSHPNGQKIAIKEEVVNGIKVERFNIWKLRFFVLNPVWWRSLKKGDVIDMQNFMPLPGLFISIITILLKILHLKKYYLVLSSHGWWDWDPNLKVPLSQLILRKFKCLIGIRVVNWAVDAIKVVSEEEKELMVRLGVASDKISIIKNGVPDEIFSQDFIKEMEKINVSGKLSWGKYLIQIARIERVKNIETVIKCLNLLPADVSLLLLGGVHDNAYKEELVELVRSNGLQDRVVFLGHVGGLDKYYLLKHSLGYIQLSFYESFGISVLEALAMGCVCVVSKGTGLSKMVEDGVNGFTVEALDYSSAADYVGKIINGMPGLAEMRQRNIEKAKQNSWGKIVREVEDFYLKLSSANT